MSVSLLRMVSTAVVVVVAVVNGAFEPVVCEQKRLTKKTPIVLYDSYYAGIYHGREGR